MATLEKFTEEMAEALFKAPKHVASKILWKPDGKKIKFRAQVLTEDGEHGLELFGYWGFSEKYKRVTWGFSLIFQKHPIRQYDMAKRHKNPTGLGTVVGPHKHKFHSRISRIAYKPNPAICDTEPNKSLMDFLVEANIRKPSDYQDYMFMVSGGTQ